MAHRMRERRFGLFRSLMGRLSGPVRVLDVGGRVDFWRMMGFANDTVVTILNIEAQTGVPGFQIIAGDARDMRELPDDAFDVVFSNSVIEHVGTWDDQRRAAAEMRRVGRRYFVQTPNRYFPIEPHFLVPGFQFLPVSVRAAMIARRKLGWMARAPDHAAAVAKVEQIRLLSRSEVRALFPGASIYTERLLGLPKSFVAYGGW
jgi:hypothetical protein